MSNSLSPRPEMALPSPVYHRIVQATHGHMRDALAHHTRVLQRGRRIISEPVGESDNQPPLKLNRDSNDFLRYYSRFMHQIHGKASANEPVEDKEILKKLDHFIDVTMQDMVASGHPPESMDYMALYINIFHDAWAEQKPLSAETQKQFELLLRKCTIGKAAAEYLDEALEKIGYENLHALCEHNYKENHPSDNHEKLSAKAEKEIVTQAVHTYKNFLTQHGLDASQAPVHTFFVPGLVLAARRVAEAECFRSPRGDGTLTERIETRTRALVNEMLVKYPPSRPEPEKWNVLAPEERELLVFRHNPETLVAAYDELLQRRAQTAGNPHRAR